VTKIGLMTHAHTHPYYIQWLNNSGKAKVTHTAHVQFSIATYHDYADCDVVLMQACFLLLGYIESLISMLFTMVEVINIHSCTIERKLPYFLLRQMKYDCYQINLILGTTLPNCAAYRTSPEETKEI
jgi:hypothetical protein